METISSLSKVILIPLTIKYNKSPTHSTTSQWNNKEMES